jgi:predicted transglutaminase-like cysteine proteinase
MHRLLVSAGAATLLLVTGFLADARAQSSVSSLAAQSQTHSATAIESPPGFRSSCARLSWLCTDIDDAVTAIDPGRLLLLADAVNRHVNATVAQLSDPENYGVAEHWTLPENGRGDCEDFVLRKYKDLLDAGVPARYLSVAIVLDWQGDNHAVLVLHHASGDLVLDSLTSSVLPWNRSGYRFLAMQSARNKARWEIVDGAALDSAFLAMR